MHCIVPPMVSTTLLLPIKAIGESYFFLYFVASFFLSFYPLFCSLFLLLLHTFLLSVFRSLFLAYLIFLYFSRYSTDSLSVHSELQNHQGHEKGQ
jgi:hypothetical protein